VAATVVDIVRCPVRPRSPAPSPVSPQRHIAAAAAPRSGTYQGRQQNGVPCARGPFSLIKQDAACLSACGCNQRDIPVSAAGGGYPSSSAPRVSVSTLRALSSLAATPPSREDTHSADLRPCHRSPRCAAGSSASEIAAHPRGQPAA
jgi:hypothetical protein